MPTVLMISINEQVSRMGTGTVRGQGVAARRTQAATQAQLTRLLDPSLDHLSLVPLPVSHRMNQAWWYVDAEAVQGHPSTLVACPHFWSQG